MTQFSNSEKEKGKGKEKKVRGEEKKNEMRPYDYQRFQDDAPMNVDRTESYIDVSDDDDNNPFGSLYAVEAEFDEDRMNIDMDEEPTHPASPTSTNISRPLASLGSTITTLPSSKVSYVPPSHQPALATRGAFTQQRSPLAFEPTLLTQTRSPASISPQVALTTRNSPHWQQNPMPLEPPGLPAVCTPHQPLCLVCNEKPAYNDGHRAFPTCGNSCARRLEAVKKTPRNGAPQRAYSGAVTKDYNPPSTSSLGWRSQTEQPPFKMCDVCRLRPKYQKNGKTFPTCGFTCAAKLQSSGSAQMCEFCRERPRILLNGTKFPYCGVTCRDKAENAGRRTSGTLFNEIAVPRTTIELDPATCKSCLICWKNDRMSDETDFCSDACRAVADAKAPFLLEIPRGHAAFDAVSNCYTSEWKDTQATCPEIKKVYMVMMKPDFAPKYEKYRARVNRPFFKRSGNEQRVWLGLTRECGLGDSGNMEPCGNKKCILCSLVRSCVSKEATQRGIVSTSSLARALETSSHRRKTSKVIVLANVLLGRETVMTKHQLGPGQPPPQECESVHLVEYRMWGGKIDNGESLVFNGDAMRPLYVITRE